MACCDFRKALFLEDVDEGCSTFRIDCVCIHSKLKVFFEARDVLACLYPVFGQSLIFQIPPVLLPTTAVNSERSHSRGESLVHVPHESTSGHTAQERCLRCISRG